MFAALGIDVSDVLLYFLESALNFPARGMKLEHLFCRNYFDMASEQLGHAEQLGELNFSVFPSAGTDNSIDGDPDDLGTR